MKVSEEHAGVFGVSHDGVVENCGDVEKIMGCDFAFLIFYGVGVEEETGAHSAVPLDIGDMGVFVYKVH
jgi:hypothetical protein